MNLKIESGRSMVEMLGTLAIIGVLSIGGIAGYSYGMDKYRCNQTINDVMLMGVDIITQTSRGVVPTLSEWGTKTTAGYDFSVEPNPTDATKSGIVVDGVPSRVCQMVGDALKTQATVYVGNVDYTTANTNPCEASEENTMKFYFEGGKVNEQGELICEPACGEGEQCANGFCFKEDKPIVSKMYGSCGDCGSCGSCLGTQCMPDREGLACPLSATETGQCNDGQCLPKEGCSDKNPCQESGTYCASTNSSCTEAFGENETGVCVKPDFVAQKINGQIYYISNGRLSWWDAKSACQTINRDMISINDVLIGWDKTSSNTFERTELGKALKSIIIHGIYIWAEAVDDDDCNAWIIQPSYGGDNYVIVKSPKNSCEGSTNYIAICK